MTTSKERTIVAVVNPICCGLDEYKESITACILYGYVAVCPALGKLSALVLPWANTAMMRLFLDQVSRDFKEYFLIILMDQAGWHVSQHLMVPENIRIIRQPARSPR